ncbi:glutamate receptor U1-like isoform X3 [Portunus trituberculatus]|uniref:glutamate receptor U1-like isoform X3 n=1 Tax=Portunus trituberculatus TaxID=210409 RepID=UPI001E1CEC29|nr:glutamate receptor U1-like isoform X3 [Portunus trituberculatus]XP_045110456.1 glutamate receptor U1-like isoform X3 [Portunus trituberculatus]
MGCVMYLLYHCLPLLLLFFLPRLLDASRFPTGWYPNHPFGHTNVTLKDPSQHSVGHETFLRVAVEEWEPHVKVREASDGTITISGPMANLLNALADTLNFSYTLVRPPDGAWGAPDELGNWNGMIGMVRRNEADLALGPFGMTEERTKAAEFSYPIMIDYYKILVKRAHAQLNPWGFLNPLQPLVWLGVWLTFCVACITLTLSRLALEWERLPITSNIMVALRCSWDQLAILLQQTLQSIPDTLSAQAMIGLWLLTVMVIMRSYSSALTSLLAVRHIPVKINNLRDLIDEKEYGLIFETSTALTAYMKDSKKGIYLELEETKAQGRSQFLKAFELLQAARTLVKHEDYALLVEITTIKKILSDDFSSTGSCDYYIAKEHFFPLIFCIIGRHGLHHMPFINFIIQSMVEHDLYSNWLYEEFTNATACLKAPISITVKEPYGIVGLWGMFTLLFVGLMLAGLTFLVELVVHAWNKNKENPTLYPGVIFLRQQFFKLYR